jgi:hypothetical protein
MGLERGFSRIPNSLIDVSVQAFTVFKATTEDICIHCILWIGYLLKILRRERDINWNSSRSLIALSKKSSSIQESIPVWSVYMFWILFLGQVPLYRSFPGGTTFSERITSCEPLQSYGFTTESSDAKMNAQKECWVGSSLHLWKAGISGNDLSKNIDRLSEESRCASCGEWMYSTFAQIIHRHNRGFRVCWAGIATFLPEAFNSQLSSPSSIHSQFGIKQSECPFCSWGGIHSHECYLAQRSRLKMNSDVSARNNHYHQNGPWRRSWSKNESPFCYTAMI